MGSVLTKTVSQWLNEIFISNLHKVQTESLCDSPPNSDSG